MSNVQRSNVQRSTQKAFLTGGTGFIGSHLVEELLRRGVGEVRCLVRGAPKWLEGMDVTLVRGDLADEEALRAGVEGVEYVYHVAGLTRSPDPEAFFRANVDATLRLLRAVESVSPNVEKVLITSSLAAVGPCPEGVADETSPLDPISTYGRSKAEMERAIAPFFETLPITVVRPPAVYGPRETDILAFFKTVRLGLCPMVGNGREKALSLVHVRDLVRGMVDAAEHPEAAGETYFISSEAYYSWREVKDAATAALGRGALTLPVPGALVGAVGAAVEGVSRLFGVYPPLNREKAREILETCKMCSVEKARRMLGYRQEVPLDEGVRETIAWYKAEGWL